MVLIVRLAAKDQHYLNMIANNKGNPKLIRKKLKRCLHKTHLNNNKERATALQYLFYDRIESISAETEVFDEKDLVYTDCFSLTQLTLGVLFRLFVSNKK